MIEDKEEKAGTLNQIPGRDVRPVPGYTPPIGHSLADRLAELSPPAVRSVLIDQAAELLGVSRRTIYYRIKSGQLETVRTLGGSQRVLLSSLAKAYGR